VGYNDGDVFDCGGEINGGNLFGGWGESMTAEVVHSNNRGGLLLLLIIIIMILFF
jgi:hypothetical protein